MMELPPQVRAAAARLRLATLALIVLIELLIFAGAFLLVAGRRGDVPALKIHDAGLDPWPAALTLAVMGILLGLALWRLARMLGRVAGGAPFAAAADLRAFAFWLFLALLASLLGPLLLPLALGGRADLSLTGTDLIMLLVTGLLFLVARLLEQAQALADEHEQIV